MIIFEWSLSVYGGSGAITNRKRVLLSRPRLRKDKAAFHNKPMFFLVCATDRGFGYFVEVTNTGMEGTSQLRSFLPLWKTLTPTGSRSYIAESGW
jgi:hypothetical protein